MSWPAARTDAPAAEVPPAGAVEPRAGWIRRIGRGLLHVVVGTFTSQFALTALLAAGWTMRLARRVAWKRLAALARAGGADVKPGEPAGELPDLTSRSPRWFASETGERGWRRFLGSAGLNLERGFQSAGNAMLLTLPATALWAFAWRLGWTDSFQKGYEEAGAGPLLGLAGVVLFILAMQHLPLAHARQAVTGDWRSFWDFRLIRRLSRAVPVSRLFLAIGFVALGAPLLVLRTLPAFVESFRPESVDWSREQAEEYLGSWFFWTALVVFAFHVLLRMAAARTYASAVVRSLRRGDLAPEDLAPVEVAVVRRWGLAVTRLNPNVLPALRLAGRSGRWLLRVVAGVLGAIAWFGLAAQVFVAQFLLFVPVTGWLFHPLVQLPWLRFGPR